MSFYEDLEEFLDSEQGFAEIATIIPTSLAEYQVKGIFSNDYLGLGIGMTGVYCLNLKN